MPPTHDQKAEETDLRTRLRHLLETYVATHVITSMERYVIEHRFSLTKPESYPTYHEIGTHLRVSRERVRQIVMKAIRRLNKKREFVHLMLHYLQTVPYPDRVHQAAHRFIRAAHTHTPPRADERESTDQNTHDHHPRPAARRTRPRRASSTFGKGRDGDPGLPADTRDTPHESSQQAPVGVGGNADRTVLSKPRGSALDHKGEKLMLPLHRHTQTLTLQAPVCQPLRASTACLQHVGAKDAQYGVLLEHGRHDPLFLSCAQVQELATFLDHHRAWIATHPHLPTHSAEAGRVTLTRRTPPLNAPDAAIDSDGRVAWLVSPLHTHITHAWPPPGASPLAAAHATKATTPHPHEGRTQAFSQATWAEEETQDTLVQHPLFPSLLAPPPPPQGPALTRHSSRKDKQSRAGKQTRHTR